MMRNKIIASLPVFYFLIFSIEFITDACWTCEAKANTESAACLRICIVLYGITNYDNSMVSFRYEL